MQCDVLIIGGGVAGLSLAIKLSKAKSDLDIVMASKLPFTESNSAHAQGGIAAAMDTMLDSEKMHELDTLRSGGGRSSVDAARILSHKIPKRIKELMDWGADFDRHNDGTLHLGLEGGHSHHRIVHRKDQTGIELMRALRQKVVQLDNVTLLENHKAISLFQDEGAQKNCLGAQLFDIRNRKSIECLANSTVLATGGCGQLFLYSTNPKGATGDGIALASEMDADISNMQYIQFHPTTLYEPGAEQNFLITEALRGHGAYILNAAMERFLIRYDPRGELATRDVVSRSIYAEMEHQGKEHVWLDMRHLNQGELEKAFPFVMNKIKSIGLDPARDLVPIAPAAHYQCGGITTTLSGESSVPGLFALGECANNGLHGTNRLASNSLAEGLVFSEMACDAILKRSISKIARKTAQMKSYRPDPDKMIQANFIKSLKEIAFRTYLKAGDELEILLALSTLSALNEEVKFRFFGTLFQREYQLRYTTTGIILSQCLESNFQFSKGILLNHA